MDNDISSHAAPPQRDSYNLLKRLIKNYVLTYKGKLAIALVAAAVAAVMTAAIAQLMQPILDDVINGQNKTLIIPVATAFLFVFVIRGAASYAGDLYE